MFLSPYKKEDEVRELAAPGHQVVPADAARWHVINRQAWERIIFFYGNKNKNNKYRSHHFREDVRCDKEPDQIDLIPKGINGSFYV